MKLEDLRLLIIGGGNVALEKLNAVLSNSPATNVTLIAPEIRHEILELAKEFSSVIIFEREVSPQDFDEADIVFIAVNDFVLAEELVIEAHRRNLLVNVADTPGFCDFYLGSIVQKGDLKIAVSTNGKSPTFSKRMKEVLNDSIPDETQVTIAHLHELRKHLKGNFREKVEALNRATAVLVEKDAKKKFTGLKLRSWLFYSFSAISLMILGHLLFTYVPFERIGSSITGSLSSIDSRILIWIAIGMGAQLVDGALGMAYGVTTTASLLSFGIPPAVASASMHASEIMLTGTSSLVYLKYRNINGKLFRSLLVPGAIGAILGACTISLLKEYVHYVKPVISVYTLVLGVLILRKAIMEKKKKRSKIRRVGVLASFGGFLDSIGGGGWGPIVTSTLLAGGRDLRYSIGSAHAAKFFVALISSVTFFFMIGFAHWTIILGLIIGGMVAAPFSIWLSTRISVRNGLALVGLLVIITSLKTIISALL
ncbi:MAG TPA: TSUP family transporter [Bacteroidia bacterium]|nr:TSUP family transporter [Bacteroidia bacterium]